jgi:hypothetical protein
MNAVKSLSDLEFSRFRNGLPGLGKKRIGLGIVYFLLLLMGSFYMFRNHESPQLLFAVVALMLLWIMMFAALLNIIAFTANPRQVWWLTFPYPRLTLVYAKVAALTRLGMSIGALLLAVCMVHYGIAVSLNLMQPIPVKELSATVLTDIVFTAAALPVFIAMGLMIVTLYRGWARWGIIPYIIVLQAPIILTGMLMDLSDAQLSLISPSYVWLYILGVVVAGWPLTYLMLRASAHKGVHNLSDAVMRTKLSFGEKQTAPTSHDKSVALPKNSVVSLYLLERTRYVYYESLKPVRLAFYAFLLLLAVGAFISAGDPGALLELSQFLFLFPVLAANIWAMNINSYEMHKKRVQWWLGFPYSRIVLLLARLAAIWVTAIRYMIAISAAFWVGAAARMILHPVDSVHLQTIGLWFLYAVLIYTVSLTTTLGLMQVVHYFMKSTFLLILIAPLYFFVALEAQIINNYLFPKNPDTSAGPSDWTWPWMLLVVGLPLAALCVMFGARHIHQLLKHESSPRWMKNSR